MEPGCEISKHYVPTRLGRTDASAASFWADLPRKMETERDKEGKIKQRRQAGSQEGRQEGKEELQKLKHIN